MRCVVCRKRPQRGRKQLCSACARSYSRVRVRDSSAHAAILWASTRTRYYIWEKWNELYFKLMLFREPLHLVAIVRRLTETAATWVGVHDWGHHGYKEAREALDAARAWLEDNG